MVGSIDCVSFCRKKNTDHCFCVNVNWCSCSYAFSNNQHLFQNLSYLTNCSGETRSPFFHEFFKNSSEYLSFGGPCIFFFRNPLLVENNQTIREQNSKWCLNSCRTDTTLDQVSIRFTLPKCSVSIFPVSDFYLRCTHAMSLYWKPI